MLQAKVLWQFPPKKSLRVQSCTTVISKYKLGAIKQKKKNYANLKVM